MNGQEELVALVESHLEKLSLEIGPRPVGSANNKKAQAYIASIFAACGLNVSTQSYPCLDWQYISCGLWCAGSTLPVRPNPFSPACDLTAPFVPLDTIGKLEQSSLCDKIALVCGELSGQLKNDNTQARRLLDLLVEKEPLAVIAVAENSANHKLIIGDGSFPLPSASIPQASCNVLLAYKDHMVNLRIESDLTESEAANIIGERQSAAPKIVVCAHLDTKYASPGAIDNASGVAALLALAQEPGFQLVALNGEEYSHFHGLGAYSDADPEWENIVCAVNLDGIGVRGEKTRLAAYGCHQEVLGRLGAVLERHPEIVHSEAWVQNNCKFFAKRGVPSFALRSCETGELVNSLIHTKGDEPYLLSPASIAATVRFLLDLRQAFCQTVGSGRLGC